MFFPNNWHAVPYLKMAMRGLIVDGVGDWLANQRFGEDVQNILTVHTWRQQGSESVMLIQPDVEEMPLFQLLGFSSGPDCLKAVLPRFS